MKPILSIKDHITQEELFLKNHSIHNIIRKVGKQIANFLVKNFKYNHYLFLIGNGKNGKDGLATIKELNKLKIKTTIIKDLKNIDPNLPIIDALIGTGLHLPLKQDKAILIKKINSLPNFKIAIDLPSGFPSDLFIKPDLVLSLNNLKLELLLPHIDFKTEVIDLNMEITSSIKQLEYEDFKETENDFYHKYQKGHLLIIAGDDSYIGATVLASMAAIRSCGIVTVLASKKFRSLFPMEVIFKESIKDFNYDAILFGQGQTKIDKKIIKAIQNKLAVIDALATRYFKPTDNLIFTPHLGEFKKMKLKGDTFLEKLTNFKGNIVVKGPISYLNIQKELFFLNYPNQLLATAGSGDILAGLIGGYLARYKDIKMASILGVTRHSLAGKMAKDIGYKNLWSTKILSFL